MRDIDTCIDKYQNDKESSHAIDEICDREEAKALKELGMNNFEDVNK